MRFSKTLIAFTLMAFAAMACQQQKNNTSPAEAPSSELTTQLEETSRSSSSDTTEAEVVIVKYSDYQCPACKYYARMVEQAKEDFGDQIEVVYKHFPLSIHPYAEVAARAVEAARKQGKYEEMHDMIFAGQEQWSRSNAELIFVGYARTLELDVYQFRSDLNSAAMQRIVIADKREGLQLGINSTPTFFINDVKLENNPGSYEQFATMIEAALGQ